MGKDLNGKELGAGISQEKDGRYCARYINSCGKRLVKKSKNLREIKQWLINAKSDNSKDSSGQKVIKLKDWYKMYFSMYLEGKQKEGTIYLKDYYWRKIEPTFGEYKIHSIKNYEVQLFVNELHDSGVSETTLKRTYDFFEKLMEKAMANNYITKNPCSGINISFVKKLEEDDEEDEDEEIEKLRVVSLKDFEQIMDQVVSDTYRSIYTVAIGTGLRVSELVGLKWNNVDFEKETIRVKEQLVWRQRIKVWERTTPKSKKGIRIIPMRKSVKEALLEMKALKDSYPAPDNPLFENLVFKTKTGNVVNPNDLNKRLTNITKLLKLPHVSMHDFRHTYATNCVEKGVKPKTLQKLMGHSSLATTLNVYYHTSLENDSELQKLLAE